jgi:putative FmdB family regulatory protein
MPTYEYACTRCGQHVEVFQHLSEPPLETCGACGGPLRKVFHPAGIVFKGSGFYSTDSRSKPKGKSETGDGAKGEKKEAATNPEASSSSGSGSDGAGSGSGGDSGTTPSRGTSSKEKPS